MSLHVFNQYYFDLLKKLKDCARSNKSVVGRATLKAIKDNYGSYDKGSGQYRDAFIDGSAEAREAWLVASADAATRKDWLATPVTENTHIFTGVSFKDAVKVLKNSKTVLHYFALLCIFGQSDLADDEVSTLVALLKGLKDHEAFATSVTALECSDITKANLAFIVALQRENLEQAHDAVSDTMKDLESTSLGKLAKEIMSDVNVEELHQSISGEGDILKALSNPDGGLAKLMSTVSQKMISKMASGEIQQETLLQDAIKFSSQLQNMMPGGGAGAAGAGLGDLGAMMSQVQNLASMMGSGDGGDGGIDLSKIMEMMGGLGGGGRGGTRHHAPTGTRSAADSATMSRVAKAKQMRRKLEKRRQAAAATAPKENVTAHVEGLSNE